MSIERNKVFLTQTIYNYFYQSFFLIVNFLLVPLTIKYLGNAKYGAWILLLSIVSWMNVTDFGLGNGLRNKIAQHYNISNKSITIEYIASAFVSVSLISLIICIVGMTFLLINDLSHLLNQKDTQMIDEIRVSLFIVFVGFCINFILGIYKSIANGIQKSSWNSESQAVNAILLLLFTLLLSKFCETKLIYIALIYVASLTLSNIFLMVRIYHYDKLLIASVHMMNKDRLKDILGIGFDFFVIQVCMIIIFSTDNILITKLFGLEFVTQYSIIDKIFTFGNTAFAILLISIWSAITKAYAENDHKWIQQLVKKMYLFFSFFVIGVFFVGFFLNDIVEIWIGHNMNYSFSIIALFVLYTILSAYGAIFVNVANGLGKIKLQKNLMIIAAIVNIPLSIILGHYYGFGIIGIKLGTLISLIPLWIFVPLNIYKILNTLKEK